jgi:hypothetical protein
LTDRVASLPQAKSLRAQRPASSNPATGRNGVPLLPLRTPGVEITPEIVNALGDELP